MTDRLLQLYTAYGHELIFERVLSGHRDYISPSGTAKAPDADQLVTVAIGSSQGPDGSILDKGVLSLYNRENRPQLAVENFSAFSDATWDAGQSVHLEGYVVTIEPRRNPFAQFVLGSEKTATPVTIIVQDHLRL